MARTVHRGGIKPRRRGDAPCRERKPKKQKNALIQSPSSAPLSPYTPIATVLKQIGAEMISKKEKRTRWEQVLRQVYKYALEGQAWAVHFIAERTEGKPSQIVVNAQTQNNNIIDNRQTAALESLSLEDLLAVAKKITGVPIPALELIEPDIVLEETPGNNPNASEGAHGGCDSRRA